MEGISLQEHFATLEDPRVERTKPHQSTSHYHHRVMCGDLRSRHLGTSGTQPLGYRKWPALGA